MSREHQLAKDRVRNATRALREHSPEVASVGMSGALVYALLDIANAIRDQGPDDKTKRLLAITDLLIDAIADGDEKRIKTLAQDFQMIREGGDFDQHVGLTKPE